MKSKEIILLAASAVVSILILEAGLRIFTPYPIGWTSNQIVHEKLGYVMDPGLHEIDKAGFRNSGSQSPVIIAIGDSFTFGTNVNSEQTWPKVLGRMLGKNVYN